MEPLYGAETQLVGWYDLQAGAIFDTSMRWLVWVADGQAWSVAARSHCGPVEATNCLERQGRVVAWNPTTKPAPGKVTWGRPATPFRPGRPTVWGRPSAPFPPSKPFPLGRGWSPVSFVDWALAGR